MSIHLDLFIIYNFLIETFIFKWYKWWDTNLSGPWSKAHIRNYIKKDLAKSVDCTEVNQAEEWSALTEHLESNHLSLAFPGHYILPYLYVHLLIYLRGFPESFRSGEKISECDWWHPLAWPHRINNTKHQKASNGSSLIADQCFLSDQEPWYFFPLQWTTSPRPGFEIR